MGEPQRIYVTMCKGEFCAGGDEFLREEDAAKAPCSWCGGETEYVSREATERDLRRLWARAEGFGFIDGPHGLDLLD